MARALRPFVKKEMPQSVFRMDREWLRSGQRGNCRLHLSRSNIVARGPIAPGEKLREYLEELPPSLES